MKRNEQYNSERGDCTHGLLHLSPLCWVVSSIGSIANSHRSTQGWTHRRNLVPQSKIQLCKTTALLPPSPGNVCVPDTSVSCNRVLLTCMCSVRKTSLCLDGFEFAPSLELLEAYTDICLKSNGVHKQGISRTATSQLPSPGPTYGRP